MKKVAWKSLRVGEPFYYYGCEGFAVKINEVELMILDNINWYGWHFVPGQVLDAADICCTLYRLSEQFQKEFGIDLG